MHKRFLGGARVNRQIPLGWGREGGKRKGKNRLVFHEGIPWGRRREVVVLWIFLIFGGCKWLMMGLRVDGVDGAFKR